VHLAERYEPLPTFVPQHQSHAPETLQQGEPADGPWRLPSSILRNPSCHLTRLPRAERLVYFHVERSSPVR
jgi:hypothetical protein